MSSSRFSPEAIGRSVRSRPKRWIGGLIVVAAVLAGVVVWQSHGSSSETAVVGVVAPHADASIPGTPVNVGLGDECGRGWSGGRAGRQTFALWNSTSSGMEVYLEDASTKKVYLDVEALGAGSTRSSSTVLGAGSYRFFCVSDDTSPGAGAVERVTGSTGLPVTPGLKPVTADDIRPLMTKYERWVAGRLPVLRRQVGALDADVRSGDLVAARSDWLTAHSTYETLGAAYGAFGRLDTAIDGDPPTTTTALADRHLRGFHKIEALLWSAAPAPRVAPFTAALGRSVAALQTSFTSPGPHMAPLDVGLRAHEILEDADLTTANGTDDYGSHTSLATIDANITGTDELLDVLEPVLRSTDPELAQTRTWLARTRRLVRGLHHSGSWTPLQHLSRTQREDLDADLGEDVELLSHVAVITDPRPADVS
ncbi:MAG: EfeM/EfeO family lipoprotein [Nocardioidaceae bacterium]|nr:EfeM/EfeO family lipoprotein [Nocardioidaceae bacterium]MCL2613720.1 EfeM/EfeO family lipoprotein [Nocardioidaceae bacterium]